jgi:hypothetical protein
MVQVKVPGHVTLNQMHSLIFTEGLIQEDLSNWRRIQAIIQQSSQQNNNIPTQDLEL